MPKVTPSVPGFPITTPSLLFLYSEAGPSFLCLHTQHQSQIKNISFPFCSIGHFLEKGLTGERKIQGDRDAKQGVKRQMLRWGERKTSPPTHSSTRWNIKNLSKSEAWELQDQGGKRRKKKKKKDNTFKSKCTFYLRKWYNSIQNTNVSTAVLLSWFYKGLGVGLGNIGLSLKLGLQICFNHSLS